MWNRLIAVVEEQAQIMIRTAFSTTVREAGDLSAGVFDLEGRMLAQAVTGTPGHVNSMAESVGHFLRKFPAATMRPGDHYITNDPWLGTGHLHDLTVVTPAFHRGRIVGLFANTAHVIDVGGLGMGPEGRSVFEEGLYIPIVKCFDAGRPNETFFDFIRAGSRLPVELEGDVYSLCACNDAGARRLDEMMAEFDLDTLAPLAEFIFSASLRATLAEIARLPGGTYRGEIRSDGYEEEVTLRAAMTILRGRDRGRLRRHLGPLCRAASTCRPPIPAPIPASASRWWWRRTCRTTGRACNRSASRSPKARSWRRRAPIRSRSATSSAICCPT